MSRPNVKIHPLHGPSIYRRNDFLRDHPTRDEVSPIQYSDGRTIIYRPTEAPLRYYSGEGSLMITAWVPGSETLCDSGFLESIENGMVTFWCGFGGDDIHTVSRSIDE